MKLTERQSRSSFLYRIGQTLRAREEDLPLEPLPDCWVGLIQRLDERERERDKPKTKHPRLITGGTA
jgi:hypothetical protein